MPAAHALSAQGLSKRYGALLALDHVDFALRPGEAVGIVGPNGAGKTTLLNLLSGAHAASAGRIAFQGVDMSGVDAARRCRMGVARTHQVPQPFGGMTVFENVLTAATHGSDVRGAQAYERCIDVLELCGMTEAANCLAESLGLLDRKRLELARALATDPRVVLLDEIGGGLTDGEAAEMVLILRVVQSRGIAIVWIEHIVHVLLQVVTRLVCLDAGRVIADGEPHTVLASALVVDAYLGVAS